MRRSERLGIAVSLILLGLIASAIITFPERQITWLALGSELRLTFSGSAQIALLLGLIAAAGVDATVRSHPDCADSSLFYTATFWSLPVLLTVASVVWLPLIQWWGYQLLFISLTGVLLTLAIYVQYRSIGTRSGSSSWARLALNVMVYGAALVSYLYLYGSRLRSMVSATGLGLVSGALALDLLRDAGSRPRHIWLFALVIGISMGELTWAINYLGVSVRVGGAFLLLIDYALVGVAQQHLLGQLRRRVLLEYGLIGLGALVGLGVLGYP